MLTNLFKSITLVVAFAAATFLHINLDNNVDNARTLSSAPVNSIESENASYDVWKKTLMVPIPENSLELAKASFNTLEPISDDSIESIQLEKAVWNDGSDNASIFSIQENTADAASLKKEIKEANKKIEKKGIKKVKKVYKDIADDHIDGAESILRTHFDYYSRESIYQDAWDRYAALTDAGPGVYEVTFDLTHRRKEDRQRAKREMSDFRQIVKSEGYKIKKVAANRYKVKIE